MELSTIGIAGLGLLGRGIATCLLANGFRVVAHDTLPGAFAVANEHIASTINDLIAHGAAPQQRRTDWQDRFVEAWSVDGFAPCDFVIESIPEDVDAKRDFFNRLETVVRSHIPIASNTSGLPITLLQADGKHPERFVGMHWAEPCHLTRFLEIVRGGQTNDATIDAAIALGKRCGKDPALVNKDIDGFIVNRLGYAMYREAFYLLEQGVADVETIDRAFLNAMSVWANIAGPFRWMDLTGLPAYAAVMQRLFPQLSTSSHVPETIERLVESGATGIANGRGFYQYTPEEARAWQARWVENVWRVRQIQQDLIPGEKGSIRGQLLIPIFDAHLDLAWSAIQWDRDLTLPLESVREAESHMTDSRARGNATVTLPEMRRGGVAVCLATLLARAKPALRPLGGFSRRDLDFNTRAAAYAMARGQLAYYQLLERQHHIRLIRTATDLENFRTATPLKTSSIGVIMAMEGADPIVSPEQAEDWFAAGLRCVGLAHYGQGIYAMGTGRSGPLTALGRELLKEFERLGMILDLTHCAEPGFFEALDHFNGRVHASHNMCRALLPGDRQFSDDQLRRLIYRDAVVGMALDAWMLHPNWVTGQTSPDAVSISVVADHIDHICQLAGSVRHVGIGSDLDGGFGTEQAPGDLGSIAGLQKLAPILQSRGYSDTDIQLIFHGDWMRFFLAALPQNDSQETHEIARTTA